MYLAEMGALSLGRGMAGRTGREEERSRGVLGRPRWGLVERRADSDGKEEKISSASSTEERGTEPSTRPSKLGMREPYHANRMFRT